MDVGSAGVAENGQGGLFQVFAVRGVSGHRVLTLISVIMLPLTLISGIYGMNLQWLPAANTVYGFFVIMGIMIVIAGGMLFVTAGNGGIVGRPGNVLLAFGVAAHLD